MRTHREQTVPLIFAVIGIAGSPSGRRLGTTISILIRVPAIAAASITFAGVAVVFTKVQSVPSRNQGEGCHVSLGIMELVHLGGGPAPSTPQTMYAASRSFNPPHPCPGWSLTICKKGQRARYSGSSSRPLLGPPGNHHKGPLSPRNVRFVPASRLCGPERNGYGPGPEPRNSPKTAQNR